MAPETVVPVIQLHPLAVIDGAECPYENCVQAVEATHARTFPSSDPCGYAVAIFCQCVMGHKWMAMADAVVEVEAR